MSTTKNEEGQKSMSKRKRLRLQHSAEKPMGLQNLLRPVVKGQMKEFRGLLKASREKVLASEAALRYRVRELFVDVIEFRFDQIAQKGFLTDIESVKNALVERMAKQLVKEGIVILTYGEDAPPQQQQQSSSSGCPPPPPAQPPTPPTLQPQSQSQSQPESSNADTWTASIVLR